MKKYSFQYKFDRKMKILMVSLKIASVFHYKYLKYFNVISFVYPKVSFIIKKGGFPPLFFLISEITPICPNFLYRELSFHIRFKKETDPTLKSCSKLSGREAPSCG